MRGKLMRDLLAAPAVRITPADAGKTRHSLPRKAEHKDHPRGCGENYHRGGSSKMTNGSPPRMRGKHSHKENEADNRRITPADAGKTVRVCIRRVAIQDHPRGCGENLSGFRIDSLLIGSPPRMRGKQNGNHVTMWNLRITPADAGKTQRRQG